MKEVPFERAMTELEAVVRELEDGRLGLDEALVRYERGIGLIQTCQARLQAAEQRILELTGLDESGEPAVQAFRHARTDTRRN